MDHIDKNLLALLQRDARLTSSELGTALNLSASQAARRRQKLEADGIITHTSARPDPAALGLQVQAFIHVHLASHGTEQSQSFARLVDTEPMITSAWTMTGDADYLLRVWTPDLTALNALIHGVLLAHPSVNRVQSQIVMDQLKKDAPLPI